MTLQDRLTTVTRTTQAGDPIGHHRWTAMLQALADGEISKSFIVTRLALDAGEETQLDSIIAAYQALGTGAARASFLNKMNYGGILYESGDITAAQYKALLGF